MNANELKELQSTGTCTAYTMLVHVYVCRDGHCWSGLCGRDVHTMHVEYKRLDRLPSLCASAIDTRIRTHHPV